VATATITNINIAVSRISRPRDCQTLTAGTVVPRTALVRDR
jgi:hypothetical protein